ncbi:MAG: glycosyltransferase family 8 protein [Candidatus Paraimprobicoccus trichonymphae]|uniref:Glycosyltransferase family 8 protein n=1 Tax=Candidatus Paraimprobicoccus trichonymphae TaxID=3033793 RepID=A0AA48KVZ7_9FIRM|nr:MAG: glycosyltransferase family 8 protein [Candidatus Paraimprobicoccus trichonymphae]
MKKIKDLKNIVLLVLSIFFVFIIYILIARCNNAKPNENTKHVLNENTKKTTEEDINLKYVPIVISTNNNYIYPAVVSMTSLLENSDKSVFYKIHVFVSNEFSEKNKDKLLWLETKYKNCCLEFVDMKNMFNDAFVSGHVTKETYFRLKIPSILSEEKKCIYLDVDTIISKDLYELYSFNIEKYYIAGVPDRIRGIKDKERENNLGVPLNRYINAGVLLFNLEKCRVSNIEMQFEKFINERKEISLHDQDTINAVCYDGIFDLPFKFNVQLCCDLSNESPKGVIKKEWDEGIENPVIIHYPGTKPWNSLTWYATKWWVYAKHTPYIEEIRLKYKHSH